jgi:hypothetical protein
MNEETNEELAERLASKYLNAVGVRSCQFVIQFKKLSKEAQDLVNVKLVQKGFPAFNPVQTSIGRFRQSPKAKATTPPIAKTLSDEELREETELSAALNSIRIDTGIVQEFLNKLNSAEDVYRHRLCELRGIPFDGPIHDPYKAIYKDAHSHSHKNVMEVMASEKCGCFFCRATYSPEAITEFVEDGQTALCPNCGVDAVIGDKAGYELTDEFLLAMFRRWFSVPIRIRAVAASREVKATPTEHWPWQVDHTIGEVVPPTITPPEIPSVSAAEQIDDKEIVGIGSHLVASIPDEPEE